MKPDQYGQILGRNARPHAPDTPPEEDYPYREFEVFGLMRQWAATGYSWDTVRGELEEMLGVPLGSSEELDDDLRRNRA